MAMPNEKNGWRINIPADKNKVASLSSTYVRPIAKHNITKQEFTQTLEKVVRKKK